MNYILIGLLAGGLALIALGASLLLSWLLDDEDDCAGLFDIITSSDAQRQGHAKSVVSSLLRHAWELGARHAYLQVKQDNFVARRLYAQFGFEEKYLYWYRGRPGEME